MAKAKRKWSPEALAKRRATIAAKQANKASLGPNAGDALAYLLKAEQAIIRQLGKGAKRLSTAEVLTMLALNSLRGEL